MFLCGSFRKMQQVLYSFGQFIEYIYILMIFKVKNDEDTYKFVNYNELKQNWRGVISR